MIDLPVSEFLSTLPPHLAPLKNEAERLLLYPQSQEDIECILKSANASEAKLGLSESSNYALGYRPMAFLSFSKLNRLKRYRQEELLINLETGITIEQLNQLLAEKNHRLPHVYAPSRTLLSLLGEDTVSLSATRYGPLRQWVTGLEAITGDGCPIHYGGEVVKNVTGYDLNKLFIGSHHQYGLVHRVILKILPKPEASRTVLFHLEDMQAAFTLAEQMAKMIHDPEMLTLFKLKNTFGWQILVTLSGYLQMVEQSTEPLLHVARGLNPDLQELDLPAKTLNQWVERLDWTNLKESQALVIRVALPNQMLFDLPQLLTSFPWLSGADVLIPLRTGQFCLRWHPLSQPAYTDLLAFQKTILSLGGFIRVLRIADPADQGYFDLNQEPDPVLLKWQARLKQQYDPKGILGGGEINGIP